MSPAGPAVSTPLWEELLTGTGPRRSSDPDVMTCALNPRWDAVRAARDFTRDTLRHWDVGGLIDDIALVASELVTNALRHALRVRPDAPAAEESPRVPVQPTRDDGGAPRPSLRVSLVHHGRQVVCAVSDPSSLGPITRAPDHIAESGRGLHLVDAFSRSWGWHPLAGAGKVVWALFELPQPPLPVPDGYGRHRRG